MQKKTKNIKAKNTNNDCDLVAQQQVAQKLLLCVHSTSNSTITKVQFKVMGKDARFMLCSSFCEVS